MKPSFHLPFRFALWPVRRNSLRTQLIAWNILILALLLGSLGLVVRYTVQSTMMASIDRELERRTQRFFAPPPPRPPNPDNPPSDGMPEAGFPPPDDPNRGPTPPENRPGRHGPPPPEDNNPYHPVLFDFQGHSNDPLRAAPWDAPGFRLAEQGRSSVATVVVDNEPLYVLSRPFPDRGPLQGVVQAPYSLTEVRRAIAGLDRALLMLIPVGLLCAGLGGAYLTDRVLRRVRRMTQAAEHISAQEFARRLPVSGNDEFSELADTFNGLLDRLEGAFQQQEKALEQQRRFTADASHELKTPLTIIKGTTSLVLSGRTADDPARQSMQDIDRAADAMAHLVQDLLLLARSDGGQLGRNPIRLLLREVLEEAMAGMGGGDIAPIVLNFAHDALCVVGNETELTRLFSNLLDNAARYTPADGRITVTAHPEGNCVRITITDTGVGIAPEHLPHLGERFYRVDSSRTRPTGGTGLGLSICQGIVLAHQGTMTFESVSGAGTTVRIDLPQSDC